MMTQSLEGVCFVFDEETNVDMEANLQTAHIFLHEPL